MNISLPLCCATEELPGFPCSSPWCPRRATIGCQGGQQCKDPTPKHPSDGWNQPVAVNGGVAYKFGGTTIPSSIAPLERFKFDLMDFEVGGSGEVPNPTPPGSMGSLESHITPRKGPQF